MKIIVIGDIHGRAIWKEIVDSQTADKIVFIGDYFDTHEAISAHRQMENFTDIVAYKKANADKVVLLTGNHDYHYLPGVDETYSGHQPEHATDIGEQLQHALREGLLQMCFAHGRYLCTHAGVTRTWYRNAFGNEPPAAGQQIEKTINDLFIYKPLSFAFTMWPNRSPYGDNICQTPIWVRPNSLHKDGIQNLVQVVGHTQQPRVIIGEDMILVDALGAAKEYLVIEAGRAVVKKIE